MDEYSTTDLFEETGINSQDNDDSLPLPPVISSPRLPLNKALLPVTGCLSVNGTQTTLDLFHQNSGLKNSNDLSNYSSNNQQSNPSRRIYVRNNTTTSSNRFQIGQVVTQNQSIGLTADISRDYLTPVSLNSLEFDNGVSSPFYTEPNKKRYSRFKNDLSIENQNGSSYGYSASDIRVNLFKKIFSKYN